MKRSSWAARSTSIATIPKTPRSRSTRKCAASSTVVTSKAKTLLANNREVLERIALALLEREVIDANEVKLLMEGKPLPEKPRTPPPPPPQAAPSADPKVVRPELRPAPGFTRGENPAKA